MTDLVAEQVVDSGLTATYAAAVSPCNVPCDTVVLHVKNGNVAATNVTIATPGVVDGDLAVADRVVVVAPGAEKFIGPFPFRAFKQADTGMALVTFSVTATVTVAALKF